MSTENPRISNFVGLDDLQALVDEVRVEIDDGGPKWELSVIDDQLQFEEEAIPKLGISLHLPADKGRFAEAAKKARLEVEQIDLLVIAEDQFLKEREVIASMPFSGLGAKLKVVGRGARRCRALQNSREGIRLEVVLALNSPVEPEAGRPHRLGTKLATSRFRVKGFPSSGGINPVELTPDVIKSHSLSRKTQLFVEINQDLLGAESLSEAVVVYVEPELLKALKMRRTGPEYDFVGANLAVNALQQIAYGLSIELNGQPDFAWADEDVPVLAFVREKLNEVKRMGAGELSKEDTVSLLRDKPQVAASVFTGLLSYSRDARNLVTGSKNGES